MRWKKAEGAKCYSFELIDDELHVLYQKNRDKTELELPAAVRRSLKKGRTYLWSVKVCGDVRDGFAPATAYFELD